MDIIERLTERFVEMDDHVRDVIDDAKQEIKRLRDALGKYDCLHKCTEPCALYHLEKAKEDTMPHMICGWWASEALMEKSK